mmetsp:Transcript_7181/g.9742  ORF Transcript_7181/g.9742 Transcript_7181/m.9742 type:complete len:181 (-) Transcript_7181:195-737(-)
MITEACHGRVVRTALSSMSQCARNASATQTSTGRCLSSVADKPKIAQAKVKKKEKKSKKKEDSGHRDRITDILIKAYDAPVKPIPKGTEEEMAERARIAKAYTVGMFKRHNELMHDYNCKIRMKNHAIKMLPRNTMWKEEALKIDMSPEALPPIWRRIPMDSPPIPGFDISKFGTPDEDS